MRIPETWTNTYEFACHASSCRPPGSGGTGGSVGGSAYAKLVKTHGKAVADNLLSGIGRSVPGIKATVPRDPNKKPSSQYEIMKAREARQAALAQTNRARANYGMKPISN